MDEDRLAEGEGELPEDEGQLPELTRAHELETLSRRHVERILPANWICRRVEDDYGLDLRVEISAGARWAGWSSRCSSRGRTG